MPVTALLVLMLCGCNFASEQNYTVEDDMQNITSAVSETHVTEVEFVHNTSGTIQLVQQMADQISSLQRMTNQLTRQVSSLRSNNIALSVAMQAMNAAGRKETQDVRTELDEAMNVTSLILKEHGHRIGRLESQIENLNETEDIHDTETVTVRPPTTVATTTTAPKLSADCKCQYRYGNYCYFIYQWYATYTQAKRTCKRENATLGHPQDRESYRKIIELFKSRFPVGESDWHGLWLGLTLSHSDGTKVLGGEDAPYINWRRGEPSRGYSETAVMIMAGSSNEGMDDIDPSRNLSGALCMYEV